MDSSELIFRSIAVLHGIAGYVLFGIAANEEFQEFCFYKHRNPLAGDIYKYLVLAACWCLIACAILAFLLPAVAVGLAWLSILLYLLTGIVDPMFDRHWPSLCKTCVVSLGVRVAFAIALTATHWVRSGAKSLKFRAARRNVLIQALDHADARATQVRVV